MNEIEAIKRYEQNKSLQQSECKEIMGVGGREDFAIFWRNKADKLKLAKSALLLDFCQTQSFTDKELFYYRLGLNAIPTLFERCETEVQYEKALQDKKEPL